MTETIIRLAARGDGVTTEGKFVPGSIPGDSIAADGALVKGPNHVDPACRHFGQCGGCQLQHASEAVYADFVRQKIVDALYAQGLALPDFAQVHLSPQETRRRAALRALRKGKSIKLGFAQARSHDLVDLAMCPVLSPTLFGLIRPLRGLLLQLLRDRQRAEIVMTLADQGVDLLISGILLETLPAIEAVTDFAKCHALARISIDEGDGPLARWEPVPATITLSGTAVTLPAGAFLQATSDGESALTSAVCEALAQKSAIADLFSGLGTFAFAVPATRLAAEGMRDAVLALQTAANRQKRPISVEHRDLFRRPLTVKELDGFDGIILDPPRAGAAEQMTALAKSAVSRIAYVSCNPATFARDAKQLIAGGYTLDRIWPVGQFRWSTHVELASQFSRT